VKLKKNHLYLIHHLAQFGTLDYRSCLQLLDHDSRKASYAFRPLTKNKYISKKNNSVTILAKGRELFPDVKPLVSMGGGSRARVNLISRNAMLLRKAGIEIVASPELTEYWCFVPSTCWRRIRHGILSTVRFTGILFFKDFRLAVYDIGDGNMDWQLMAEKSLFYPRYNEEFNTEATGMLFICDNDKRIEIAKKIIRETVRKRKPLIEYESYEERTRPAKFVRVPIKVTWRYEHVYLTTPKLLSQSLDKIANEKNEIERLRGDRISCMNNKWGDFDAPPRRFFVNITTDLLKYAYFFTEVKSGNAVKYSIIAPTQDIPIIHTFPRLIEKEGVQIHEYKQ